MPKPYSIDLRSKVIEAYKNGEGSIRNLAKRFKVSKNFVSDLIQLFKQTGGVEPRPHGGGNSSSIDEDGQAFIKKLIEEQPDIKLEDIRDRYNENHPEPVSRSTIDRILRKCKITRKKKSFFDPRKNSPENVKKQEEYKKNIAPFDAGEMIFIDETGSVRNMTGNYARSPQGQPAKCAKSLTRGTRISTAGALTVEGVVAAFCYTGTMNAELFRFFVENFLIPILTPKNVVVLDNASTHYDETAIEMIEVTGAGIIFLPPYCPELNPIEYIWAKVKNFIKKTVISNTEELYQTIADALKTITFDDALNSINHCL